MVSIYMNEENIPSPVLKRINNEINKYKHNYDTITCRYIQDNKTQVEFKTKYNCYIFTIQHNYPFSPPTLVINGKKQHRFFNLSSNRFRRTLKYIGDINCLCCNSYLCENNWSPSISLDMIIKQITQYKIMKYKIIVKIILDKIKETYLNRDIDIVSWLFNTYDVDSYLIQTNCENI